MMTMCKDCRNWTWINETTVELKPHFMTNAELSEYLPFLEENFRKKALATSQVKDENRLVKLQKRING